MPFYSFSLGHRVVMFGKPHALNQQSMCQWLIRALALNVLNAKFLVLSTLNKEIPPLDVSNAKKIWHELQCAFTDGSVLQQLIYIFSLFFIIKCSLPSNKKLFFILCHHRPMSLLFFSSLCLSTKSLCIALYQFPLTNSLTKTLLLHWSFCSLSSLSSSHNWRCKWVKISLNSS